MLFVTKGASADMRQTGAIAFLAIFCAASHAGEVTILVKPVNKPQNADLSVMVGTGAATSTGKISEGIFYQFSSPNAEYHVRIDVEYRGREYTLDPGLDGKTGCYDVILDFRTGKPELALRERELPADLIRGPRKGPRERPRQEQSTELSARWRVRMAQAGNAALPGNWRSKLEIESMDLGKEEQKAILKLADGLRGRNCSEVFLGMDDKQRKACIAYPTLRAVARPFAEAKTEMIFELSMTSGDWAKIREMEEKDKRLYRQQFGLIATPEEISLCQEIAKGLSAPDWRQYRQKLSGTAAETAHSNPILRHMYFRYVDAEPGEIEAHQRILRRKEEEAQRRTPEWQAAEAERREREAENQRQQRREKAAWGKFTLANSYAKSGARGLALGAMRDLIKTYPDTRAGETAKIVLAKWQKGDWVIQEPDCERPAVPEEAPEVARGEPEGEDRPPKRVDPARTRQLVELVEGVETRLIGENAEKWNALIRKKAEEFATIRKDYEEDWEAFEASKKSLTNRQKRAFRDRKATFTRQRDVLEQDIFDAKQARDAGYARIHGEALKLIRAIKAGKYESLTEGEAEAILTGQD